MLTHPVIKRFLSGFLLVLFTFSVTPKQLLHNLVANHKDATATGSKTPQVNKAGFNCQCDNLVAESPFTDDSNPIEITTPVLFAGYKLDRVTGFHSAQQFFSELRGPPARL